LKVELVENSQNQEEAEVKLTTDEQENKYDENKQVSEEE
jgi:hypothetical protein